jgi:hypothetical protein
LAGSGTYALKAGDEKLIDGENSIKFILADGEYLADSKPPASEPDHSFSSESAMISATEPGMLGVPGPDQPTSLEIAVQAALENLAAYEPVPKGNPSQPALVLPESENTDPFTAYTSTGNAVALAALAVCSAAALLAVVIASKKRIIKL